ncbi:MAG TPA: ubiquinol-cytochrome C chaperone family protein [Alphaproteobacteria bacterium]|jgi:cytochrome b pre-mRNA-processing protein 3
MMLRNLFRRSGTDAAAALYSRLVAQARQPGFYTVCAVPDTVQGRFEMIALHAFLVMRRLKTGGAAGRLSQDLFDLMFADMDRNLRELGTGDLAVGKRIKKLAKAFYGRVGAYEEGLDGSAGTLESALARNAYEAADGETDVVKEAVPAIAVAALAAYVRQADGLLTAQPVTALSAGDVQFPLAPAAV